MLGSPAQVVAFTQDNRLRKMTKADVRPGQLCCFFMTLNGESWIPVMYILLHRHLGPKQAPNSWAVASWGVVDNKHVHNTYVLNFQRDYVFE